MRHAIDDLRFEEVRFADKLRDELRRRAFVNFERRSDLQHVPRIHNGDVIRHGKRFALIVRHVDERYADFIVQIVEIDEEICAKLCVECGKRFVE